VERFTPKNLDTGVGREAGHGGFTFMKKLTNAVIISFAVAAMLLPVISAVNHSISNVSGSNAGHMLIADGGPNPPPPPPPQKPPQRA
jgi:hypothetical protein